MNTGIRRFILRVIVGVLTFAAGVAAATLLGGFTPFRSYAPATYERYRSSEYRRHDCPSRLEAPGTNPDTILLKGPHGIRVRKELRAMPAIPPDATAPVPPGPPLEQR